MKLPFLGNIWELQPMGLHIVHKRDSFITLLIVSNFRLVVRILLVASRF